MRRKAAYGKPPDAHIAPAAEFCHESLGNKSARKGRAGFHGLGNKSAWEMKAPVY